MSMFPLNDTTFKKWRIELRACRGQEAHPEVFVKGEGAAEKGHQYYRRCTLCDPDLIMCPVCNGSGKVPRPSSEDDLLVDESTYPIDPGRLLLMDSPVYGEKPATTVTIIRWY